MEEESTRVVLLLKKKYISTSSEQYQALPEGRHGPPTPPPNSLSGSCHLSKLLFWETNLNLSLEETKPHLSHFPELGK